MVAGGDTGEMRTEEVAATHLARSERVKQLLSSGGSIVRRLVRHGDGDKIVVTLNAVGIEVVSVLRLGGPAATQPEPAQSPFWPLRLRLALELFGRGGLRLTVCFVKHPVPEPKPRR